MIIKQVTDKEKQEVRRMWEVCFPDGEPFLSFYFEHVYRSEYTLAAYEGETMAASVQVLPYTLKAGERVCQMGYISGAATLPEYRRRGLMPALLTAAFERMKEQGMDGSILIPQEEWLFGYYKRFGYETAFYLDNEEFRTEPDRGAGAVRTGTGEDYPLYDRLLRQKTTAVLKSRRDFENMLLDHRLGGGELLVLPGRGLCFAILQEGELLVKELLAEDETARDGLLAAAGERFGKSRGQIAGPGGKPLGMLQWFCKEPPALENPYMNMMLN